jgi:hypothetical protein
MIGFLPEIYPDELFYSWIARYYCRTGYSAYIDAIEDIFQSRTVRPDIEFLTKINPAAIETVSSFISLHDLLMNHTLFPYYARFLPHARRARAYELMVRMEGDPHDLLAIPDNKRGQLRRLRYCPVCVEENREKYGETYWKRSHQLIGVDVCPIHGCYLKETNVVIAGKASPRLHIAEQVIGNIASRKCADSASLRLAEYMIQLFQQPLLLESTTPVGQFLNSKLEWTKYMSPRGDQRRMRLLLNDLHYFYGESAPEAWKVHKVLNGYCWTPVEVCQLALFLGITPEELSTMALPPKSQPEIIDEQIHALHDQGVKAPEIARRLGLSVNTVKPIAGRYRRHSYPRGHGLIAGRKSYDWEAIDTKLLPRVQEAIDQLCGDGVVRPRRVNVTAVKKMLHLPDGQLNKLPRCMALIQEHWESQPEYWAKEVVWAYGEVLRRGEQLNYKHIRDITNMRRRDFEACERYLELYTSADIATVIRKVVL